MGEANGNQATADGDEDFDLFVSYAHSDDEVPIGAEQGWVTTLVGQLRSVLRHKLGRDGALMWSDHSLGPNQPCTPTILGNVSRSRVLVPVLSRGYLRSPWCQSELEHFVGTKRQSGVGYAVFPIEILPLARETLPAALSDLVPIRFWESAGADGIPRRAGFPKPNPDEFSLYWTAVNKLGHLIAEHLEEVRPPQPLPRWQPAPVVSGPISPASPGGVDPASGLSLYLHAAPEDKPNADRIAEHLESAGATVRLTPSPGPGQTYFECLREQEDSLRLCDGLILVNGQGATNNLAVAFQLAMQAFGVKRPGVWSAALNLPPPGKPAVPIRSRNLMQVDCSAGFEVGQLAPFFQALKANAASTGAAGQV
jgi:hypothetical protein